MIGPIYEGSSYFSCRLVFYAFGGTVYDKI
jgi:hypothetical protein